MDSIRAYRRSDRKAVRQLAYDTAEMGKRSSFPDARLQADLLTRYYTDHEPGSLWVVELDGRVAGYLSGCLNTEDYRAWFRKRGHALTALHVIFRNFYRPAVLKWARARIRTVREGGAHRDEWVRTHPAHLHMNLSAEARGKGVGSVLLKKFIAQCRAARVPGIHLSTRADNADAKRFFVRHGFESLATINAYKPGKKYLEPVPVLVMGLKLN